MKILFSIGLLLSIILISLKPFYFTKNASPTNKKTMIKLIPVRDSIYVLEGHGGNIGVLTGTNGILLIDDQFSHMYSAIKSQLKTISKQPIKYIINTHWHVDHTNGNENFGKDGTIIIAQENSRKRMMSPQIIKVFNHHQKPYGVNGLPEIFFKNSMELYFNNQSIKLISVKHAHTDGDLLVYFKDTNVIHTGDVFVTYGYPFIDAPNGGTIQGVITAIEKIISLSDKNTLIIPGHGKLSNKQDLVAYKEMLSTILNRIEIEFNKGASITEIIATNPTKGYTSKKINEAIFTTIIVNNLKTINQ